MKKEGKKGKTMFIFLCILIFTLSFIGSVTFKITHKPTWTKEFSVEWNDSIGTVYHDLSYGDKPANKFDLYVPSGNTKENYGLVIYLHAGGFTSGDKAGDAEILQWLCSKGYVAAGVNYTLKTEENEASVYSQSLEIKESIPFIIEEAQKLGYDLNEMAISGGSAGGTLAMLYAYRDADQSPLPVKLMFEMVGPTSFHVEDWGIYGLDCQTDEAYTAAAGLFGVMSGVELTPEMVKSQEYLMHMKPISAYQWVNEHSVPSVLLYGTHDKVQPFQGVRHLIDALEKHQVDYTYFEAPHSGHGVQNDDKVFQQFMKTVVEYLEKYMPVQSS